MSEHLPDHLLHWLTALTAALAVAGAVMLRRGKPALARLIARAAMLSIVPYLVLIQFVFRNARAEDVSMAAALGRSISVSMNHGMLAVPALLGAIFVWRRANRLLRGEPPG